MFLVAGAETARNQVTSHLDAIDHAVENYLGVPLERACAIARAQVALRILEVSGESEAQISRQSVALAVLKMLAARDIRRAGMSRRPT